jgi:hypothetical protein
VPATYRSPRGESGEFRITLLPVRSAGDQVTAALCLVENARSAFTFSFPPSETAKAALKAE